MAFFQEPMAVIAYCALLCALVFWSARQSWAKRFYDVVPSVVLIYYLPMFSSSLGVIPSASPVYDWMRDYLLPFSLFILMVTTDVRSIFGVGPKALIMMLAGTLGIVLGGPLAFLIYEAWLPPDMWKALAALSGSWIGGGGNFAAIKESVGAPDNLIGPIIIVDTAVGYTWTGVLLFLASYQRIFDRFFRAEASEFEALNRRMQQLHSANARPLDIATASMTLATGLIGAVLAGWLGERVFELTGPWLTQNLPQLASIFSQFTWLVILITTGGILLSLTPLRRIETSGASELGYAALYLFLSSLGAKADLAGLLEAPILLIVGATWIVIHIVTLFIAARIIRAPLFLVAVGSQANVGGVATAPIVAAAYYPALAPVGLLMGILGYLLGNYAGLFCAFLLRLAA